MTSAMEGDGDLGKYRVIARLGAGGMAEVLLACARDGGLAPRHVAIKRMRPELTRTAEFVELFLEEARTAARLVHPNICRVHELGAEGGEPFIVLEYLQGVPLSYVVANELGAERGLDLRIVAGLIIQAGAGIQYAHDALDEHGTPLDLVHRDISPPNLFITEDGVVKVLDFGISKSRASVVRTMTGQIRGKFAYMSPEHLRGEKLDRRSDVFSLGIVLGELITGRRMFRRDNRLEIFRAIVRDPIPSIRARCPDLPDLVVDVVDRSLARDRDERFENAQALCVALARAVREVGGPAAPHEIGALLVERFGPELAARKKLLVSPLGVTPSTDTAAATWAATAAASDATAVDLVGAPFADLDGPDE
jgi:eukaryotic-like serine/threonine-protein kinase